MATVQAGRERDDPFMHEWVMDSTRDTDGYATCRKCGAIENTHWSVMLCAFVKPLRDAIGDDPAAFVEAVRELVEVVTDYQSDHGCDCWEAPNGRTETCYRCTFATVLDRPALAKVRGE